MCFLFPTLVPWCFWGESLRNSFFLSAILRYVLVLNATWLVNSAAHMFGNRPYDRNINPRENRLVTFGALGTLVAPFNSKPLHKLTVSETGRDHCTRH